MSTDYFVKGSENEITLNLKEDGVLISGPWTAVDIYIGNDGFVINRTSNASGINLTNGVLRITPALLSESLTILIAGALLQVWVRVKTAAQPNGVYFGADDSGPFYFLISDPPG